MTQETSAEILARYRTGDEQAADELFARYVGRLTVLARSRLSPRLAARTDPEDIVLSAYRSFFIGAREGRFVLSRSGDLWRLLSSIAMHKLRRQVRRQTAEKRDVTVENAADQDALYSREPSPDEALALADELEAILSTLDAFARRVLELRLQEYDLAEIAAETGRSERTIRRALQNIRERLIERLEPGAKERLAANTSAQRANEPARKPSRRKRDTAGADIPKPTFIDARAPLQFDDFLLQRMIGSGLTGRVYRARQRSRERLVAVKFLKKSFHSDRGAIERFVREAAIAAQFHHPGIVEVFGLGQTPAAGYFLAMELIEGGDLLRRIRSGPIAVAEAVEWMMQACNALAHAHQRGVIHCDLKPGNLLLDDSGHMRVTDFGMARSLREESRLVDRIAGTAAFMAPEQISGWWGELGERTDVYGLGAVLYTLLTGEPPYRGATVPDILAQVVSGARVVPPIEREPRLPAAINDVCMRCLAKHPRDRFENMESLRAALNLAR